MKLSAKDSKKVKSKLTHKYSATWLCEKGILLEVEGLTAADLKHVQFEITATEENGVFEVLGKFMGVEMEKVNVNIQVRNQL